MKSDRFAPTTSGTVPDVVELARVVAQQRAEMDRLGEHAATTVVVERAKGVVMALAGCTADAAEETLYQRAKAAGRTALEECWVTLGELTPAPATTRTRRARGTATGPRRLPPPARPPTTPRRPSPRPTTSPTP
ncbi:ANTAR domain-containing protein [Streptomyces pseudogriseolus]|uniref:ANTAR domain-containing protein n=1 Tax=Streptomyces pseudogriseolus TaxID=36817 RepID=UPI003FA21065